MTKKAYITNRKTVQQAEPDSDGWYYRQVTYGDIRCPYCNDTRRAQVHNTENGAGHICEKCANEYQIVNSTAR